MVNPKKILLLVPAFLLSLYAMAQNDSTEDVGFMRSEGKIYVVMVVVITILAGFLLYLSRLDRKISSFEKGEQS